MSSWASRRRARGRVKSALLFLLGMYVCGEVPARYKPMSLRYKSKALLSLQPLILSTTRTLSTPTTLLSCDTLQCCLELGQGAAQIWYTRLKDACAAKPDKAGKRPPRLVADVGANFGYYSLYAASMGCRRAREQHELPDAVQRHLCLCLCVLEAPLSCLLSNLLCCGGQSSNMQLMLSCFLVAAYASLEAISWIAKLPSCAGPLRWSRCRRSVHSLRTTLSCTRWKRIRRASTRAAVLRRVIAWEPVPTFRAFLEYGVEQRLMAV